MIIPLYSYPLAGLTEWKKLINAYKDFKSVETWAIVNVDSGPGNGPNSD